MNAATENLTLPENVKLVTFSPVAYYDKHMDCIRVLTHDRSVTEHRIDDTFTVYECNHRNKRFDPEYVGFTIKGVRHLFNQVGLPLDRVYRLADLIQRLISHRHGSVMSELLRIIYRDYKATVDLEVDLSAAA